MAEPVVISEASDGKTINLTDIADIDPLESKGNEPKNQYFTTVIQGRLQFVGIYIVYHIRLHPVFDCVFNIF